MQRYKLLLLDDELTDAELIVHSLEQAGIHCTTSLAQDEQSFILALEREPFDAILADNTLPRFNATAALGILHKMKLSIPFILVTGSISEEYAVEIMKQGACDYILKDRMQRLPSAVLSAIHNDSMKKERLRYMDEIIANEALLKTAARLAHFGSWEANLELGTMRWTDELYRILGMDPGEMEPSLHSFLEKVHPDDLPEVQSKFDEAIMHLDRQKYNCRIINQNNKVCHIYTEMAVKRNAKGKPIYLNGFIIDISESKQAELKEKQITADLIQRNKDLEQFAYIISHNLRAPVANIVGISNILAEYDLEKAEKFQFIDDLITSVKKLDDVILDLNRILDIRREINENKEVISLPKTVEQIVFSFGNFLPEKNINIQYNFAEIEEVVTLKSYIYSIFYNLISNSVKFRHPQHPLIVKIDTHKLLDKVVMRFEDNGIGIDMEKNSRHLFGLYKRFHPEYAEGKGIGLYMVKTQVEALGGKITANSTVNKGTVIDIEFNLSDVSFFSKQQTFS